MSAGALAAVSAVNEIDNKKILIIAGTVVIIGAIGYFGVYRPVLKKIGLIPDKKAIKNLKFIKDYKGFDPTVYRPSKVTLSPSQAKILADAVYNSVSYLTGDSEEAMYGALQQMGSFDNLSYTSKWFYNRHKRSMGDYIGEYFDRPDEIDRIKQILMSY